MTQAAYIELAQAANRDMFDEEDLPLDFSEHGLRAAEAAQVPIRRRPESGWRRPAPARGGEDPFYLKMKAAKRDVLTRRFEAIRTRLGERLQQLVAAKQASETGGSPAKAATPAILCYSVTCEKR